MNNIIKFIQAERFYAGLVIFLIFINFFTLSTNGREKPLLDKTAVNLLSENSLDAKLIAQAIKEKPFIARALSLLGLSVVLAFLSGIVLNLKYILQKIKNRNTTASWANLGKAGWKIWDVCKIVILFLFFVQLVYYLESLFFHFDFYSRMLINTYLLDSVIIALVIFMVVVKYKQKLKDLGLSLEKWPEHIFKGIVGYITLLPSIFLIMLIVLFLVPKVNYQPPIQPVLLLFLSEQRKAVLILSVILVSILGPIGEEIFFRGFMYRAVRNRFGIWVSIILSAAIFALLHSNLVGFFPIMALGVLLAYLYEKTGSLIASITVHVIHNSALVLAVFLVKEITNVL